jgi:hypothetical protein
MVSGCPAEISYSVEPSYPAIPGYVTEPRYVAEPSYPTEPGIPVEPGNTETWKENNTVTKLDARVSTENPRQCDAVTVTMDTTAMCAANTHTETSMDGGDGAAKMKYNSEIEVKNERIREL